MCGGVLMKWISVKDRLPNGERVLVKSISIGQCVASRCGDWKPDGTWGDWEWGILNDIVFNKNEVTHWMPLPKPPKDE